MRRNRAEAAYRDDRGHEVRGFVRRHSYKTGHFVLRSGATSSEYLDMKITHLHSDGLVDVLDAMRSIIATEALLFHAIAGVETGGIPLATGLMLSMRDQLVYPMSLIVRKEAKDHGTQSRVEGTENVPAGSRVLLVEDVVTTGGASISAIEALRAVPYEVIGCIAVCDREQGAKEAFEKAKIPFFDITTLREVRETWVEDEDD